MARPRNFDETTVISQAAAVFGSLGYNAASIDDLVKATGLLRGSLYKAFGSKRHLFERVLAQALQPGWPAREEAVDLLIIALKELAPSDAAITVLCRAAVQDTGAGTARLLGERLLSHLDQSPKETPCLSSN
ncbi:helix-turn-helix domain-containing protein [Janthinobacterium sp. SUN033]|uniref:helix-turn-helix domain-containing protein n=1 Tax=Janthinobacterium sp. SUN033 TaxID=3002439 RepID=UPI0025B124BC|nr:helix-turn-helix domain-containing protein [Janthinobacterium sp. SUN033]MDN2677966.1 helix-turn-helix domain containing protein [Janthinobacterium sp. SUN033]